MNEIIGICSVGKMFRPKKVLNVPHRGFIFHTTYKSNFGGATKDITIQFNIKNIYPDKEVVRISLSTDIPVLLRNEVFMELDSETAISKTPERFITANRHLVRPDRYNLRKRGISEGIKNHKGVLFFTILIESEIPEEEDNLNFVLYPSVIDGTEYIVVEGESETPLIIHSEKGLTLHN
ncbi:hypothetical protein [Bacillus thuringiensis]|uniref:hypothetical protein n=1 Tax=Bacillus thuringiensis TaxID=1428 RepID=UPI0011A48196|nr:hypothetical protein [Bacillus thuringiensis]